MSNFYYGNYKQNQNDLQHHKYIRKYRGKNGKWQYIYKSLNKGIDDYKQALSSDDERNAYREAERNYVSIKNRNIGRSLFNGKPDRVAEYNAHNKMSAAKRKYEKSKTFVGKLSDVSAVALTHGKNHIKSINRGLKFVQRRIRRTGLKLKRSVENEINSFRLRKQKPKLINPRKLKNRRTV